MPDKCNYCDHEAESKMLAAELYQDTDRPTCYAHCGIAQDGKHAADPDSIVHQRDLTEDAIVFDAYCKLCGQSGSISMTYTQLASDVQW